MFILEPQQYFVEDESDSIVPPTVPLDNVPCLHVQRACKQLPFQTLDISPDSQIANSGPTIDIESAVIEYLPKAAEFELENRDVEACSSASGTVGADARPIISCDTPSVDKNVTGDDAITVVYEPSAGEWLSKRKGGKRLSLRSQLLFKKSKR